MKNELRVLMKIAEAGLVDLEFLIWLFDHIRCLERFMELEHDPITEVEDIAASFQGADSRFVKQLFLSKLARMACFSYRVAGVVEGNRQVWNPFEESLRGFLSRAREPVVWLDNDMHPSPREIEAWLNVKFEQYYA